MDPELSGNAFKRFIRRRGLSRERPSQPSSSFPLPPGSVSLSPTPGHQQPFRHHVYQPTSGPFQNIPPPQPPPPPPLPPPPSSAHLLPPRRVSRSYTRTPSDSLSRQTTHDGTNRQPQTSDKRSRHREFTSDAEEEARKPYQCEYCEMNFRRKHHKERHVANIHRQERPYVCAICGFAFHQKPNLDRHRATVHQEMRPFACEECGMAFSKRSSLTRHVQQTHEPSRSYQCTICPARFSSSRDLSSHLSSVHRGYSPGPSASRAGESYRGGGGSGSRDTYAGGRPGPSSHGRSSSHRRPSQ